MKDIDKFLDSFVTGDYFIIFLAITLVVLVVLILALIKSREDYNELVNGVEKKEKKEEKDDQSNTIIGGLAELLSKDKKDVIDENKPLTQQIDIPDYESVIDNYELSEEENAVISAEELEKRTKERLETLGVSDNQEAIQKYEEEQENKAIISYEQLLKNASNISLTYTDEKVSSGSPKIKKIELEQKEVSNPEIYLKEEEFLKILKEFRVKLE